MSLSRPHSDYEELDHNIDSNRTSPHDPWRASSTPFSSPLPFSSHTTTTVLSTPGASSSKLPSTTKPKPGISSAEDVPVVLGVVVVDFNHLVSFISGIQDYSCMIEQFWDTCMTNENLQIGPAVEFAYPPSLSSAITDDESLTRLLPFLALPDGAHLVSQLRIACSVDIHC